MTGDKITEDQPAPEGGAEGDVPASPPVGGFRRGKGRLPPDRRKPFRPIWDEDGEFLHYLDPAGSPPITESELKKAGEKYLALIAKSKRNGREGGKSKRRENLPAYHAEWVRIASRYQHLTNWAQAGRVRELLLESQVADTVPGQQQIARILRRHLGPTKARSK